MTQPTGQPEGWWRPPPTPQPYSPSPYGQPPTPPSGHQQGPHAYGGGFQSQYQGLGAFGSTEVKQRKPKKRLLITTVVVLALTGGGLATWWFGPFQDDVLDQQSLQQGVATVLRDSYGEHNIKNLRCPADQRITTGHTFECSVEIGDRKTAVPIRVLNDKPEYEVGAPR